MKGATPLHWAASTGRLDIVQLLLSNGATQSLSVRNACGLTPLMMAKQYGSFPRVQAQLLAAAGEQGRVSLLGLRAGASGRQSGVITQIELAKPSLQEARLASPSPTRERVPDLEEGEM